MAERKTLTITQVNEIRTGDRKDGKGQWKSLSFKAKDGDKELLYSTFKTGLFEFIKEGQTINADIETDQRGEYTNRSVVQIYVDGQPVGGKGQQGYRGKSPEELEQQARVMVLSYAKDMAVAQVIPLEEITKWADVFYVWVKGNGKESPKAPESKLEIETSAPSQAKTTAPSEDLDAVFGKNIPTGKAVQNVTELKGLLGKHKIATHEAYVILSIKGFDELKDLDKAWQDIKKAKKIEP